MHWSNVPALGPMVCTTITTYLASRRNGYVTGATVNVDGGSDFI